jgi:Ni/Fe-hydrogenase 1 B-type cytochrome subunit
LDLIEFNVWLDTIFVVLFVFVLVFLLWHFAMFILTGRFRKSFIEGHWPEHEERPPATPKVLHFVHMTSMIILAATGMYLRFPYFDGGRTFMRSTHFVFMTIVIVVLVWRVWYAFRSKTNADWREFAIRKRDVKTATGVLKYYGYISNKKPHVAKYNVLQKMSYNLFLIMMVLMAFTGLALLRFDLPVIGMSPSELLVGWWLGPLVGDAASALWYTRMLHYVLNWAFIIMTTVHLYLAFTVDVPCALDFFGIKEMEVAEDAHGHGGSEEPEEPREGPGDEQTPAIRPLTS